MPARVINAAGPWVHQMLGKLGVNAASGVRLIKGSHIVVPQLFDGPQAYILQQPDRRIVFAIPYENGSTEIGTTDVPVDAPEDAVIDAEEIAYLCDAVNRHFVKQVSPADVTSTWSGVRPLYDDGASEAKAVTRDYVLELDTNGPSLCCRFLAGRSRPRGIWPRKPSPSWRSRWDFAARRVTRSRPFPGGDIGDFAEHLAQVCARWPFLGDARSERMARAYGSLLGEMLVGVQDEAGMGAPLGAGLTEIEARWMHDREWARTPEDALHRRSKLGLHMSADERAAFEKWWVGVYPDLTSPCPRSG